MPYSEVGGKFTELEWNNVPGEDGEQFYYRTSFYDGGRDGFTDPPAQSPDLFAETTNVAPTQSGTLKGRFGTKDWGARFIDVNIFNGLSFYLYEAPSTAKRRILIPLQYSPGNVYRVISTNESATIKNTNVFGNLTGTTLNARLCISRTYAYLLSQNSADRKMQNGDDTAGNGISTWGVAAPTGAPTLGATAAGNITIQFWRDYCYAYYNSTTGEISDISPFVRLTGPVSSIQQPVNNITVDSNSTNSGTTQRILLCTSDGGPRTRLFLVTTLADNTTTTYTDSTAETTLVQNSIYADLSATGQRLGVTGNQPAPNGKYVCKHRGRIYIVGLDDKLYFSKSIEEVSTVSSLEIGGRFECCFPLENVLDISTEVESVSGILSDGVNLYIGTRRNIYRLIGDGPDNYEPIQVIFKNVGVYSDKAWEIVYKDGVPVGSIWITPDFRCAFSDSSTYIDIGIPVKDILAQIQTGVEVHATTVTMSNYSFIAITVYRSGLSSLMLIYDLSRNKWWKWDWTGALETIQFKAMFFWVNPLSGAPEWIFANEGGDFAQFDTTTATDASVSLGTSTAIISNVTTSWLDMGQPETMKALNYLNIAQGQSSCTLTVYGAETKADFSSPITIVSGLSPITAPNGDKRFILADTKTRYRWYKFMLQSTLSGSRDFLSDMEICWVPLQTAL